MKQLKSVKDLDVKGKRVLVRVDLTSPWKKGLSRTTRACAVHSPP
jgi:3-phosphoglycerate kinase